jgi:enolase-phosphatase E1
MVQLRFAVHCVLMDVEGTTSSIAFVHEVMFPFARQRVSRFLASRWGSPELLPCLDHLARTDRAVDSRQWLAGLDVSAAQARVNATVNRLMDQDAKETGLKLLQGMIWEDGFRSGELVAHVYDDVAPCLRRWNDEGLDLRIYSSGSIQAQRLFFGHTQAGDLLPLLSGHYDTTTGPKREAASYRTIVADTGHQPYEVVFLSDIPAELDAAAEAGLQTCLLDRPGNASVDNCQHPRVGSFDQLDLRRC